MRRTELLQETRERDGRLEIEPAPTPMKLVRRRGVRCAAPARSCIRETAVACRPTRGLACVSKS
jgi:hypothetical protein